jgi:peptide-methionine (R)-S-oxide reductase
MVDIQDSDLDKKLTPEQIAVLRNKGTEPPFSGEFLDHDDDGVYACVACGNVLFRSDAKYDSRTPGLIGWPSFSEIAGSDAVVLRPDNSDGMHRTEVVCQRCGGHLGHVFDAGDSSTGKHYCINSTCLSFSPDN